MEGARPRHLGTVALPRDLHLGEGLFGGKSEHAESTDLIPHRLQPKGAATRGRPRPPSTTFKRSSRSISSIIVSYRPIALATSSGDFPSSSTVVMSAPWLKNAFTTRSQQPTTARSSAVVHFLQADCPEWTNAFMSPGMSS
jgi:hypothetical protein